MQELKKEYVWRRWRGNGQIIPSEKKPFYRDYPKHRGIKPFPLSKVYVEDATEEEYKKFWKK